MRSRRTLLALGTLTLIVAAMVILAWSRSELDAAEPVEGVATGYSHTCAINFGGGVQCWGENGSGQLGNGTTTDSYTPVDVCADASCEIPLSGVAAIAAGAGHTCAVTTRGEVRCWGGNGDSQLGDGTSTGSTTPVDVCADANCASVLVDVTSISAGSAHTCVVTTAGGVKCWGRNEWGQLGDGTIPGGSSTPVDVCADASCTSALSGVAAVTTGYGNTCVVTIAGGVKCWGLYTSSFPADNTPVDVCADASCDSLLSGVIAVGTGYRHTCALTSAGGVKCWGFNIHFELGALRDSEVSAPVDVCADASCASALSGVAAISVGLWHTCAVTNAGGVKCWGNNWDGQLGHRTFSFSLPVDVCADAACASDLGDVSAISAGDANTCVVTAAGDVKCWGSNSSGQLGFVPSPAQSSTPLDVCEDLSPGCENILSGIAAISAGDVHTCAMAAAGGVKCWGDNLDNQLGDGTRLKSITPVDVCAVASCASALSDVTAVAAGTGQTCAMAAAGGVKCWGDNDEGQLGVGTESFRRRPVDVCADAACTSVLSGVAAVAAGAGHSCAVTALGGVKCWGVNGFGELGDGTTTDSSTPVDVCADATCDSDLSGVAALAAGGSTFVSSVGHTCALMSGGGVKCWGDNSTGQMGDGTTTNSSTPVDVCADAECTSALSGVVVIAAGAGHTCALMSGGGVKCWGANGFGLLGNGTTTGSSTPVNVCADVACTSALSGVVAIAAGAGHTCAVTGLGGVKCWGDNSTGQMGDGTTTNSSTPVDVCADASCASDLSGVAAGASGGSTYPCSGGHTCALVSGGGVKCWGVNTKFQLGHGLAYSYVPLGVSGVKPAPAPTPKPPDADTDGDTIPNGIDSDDDGDGCTDEQELGPGKHAVTGGGRDPHYFWDFVDQWIGEPPVRDRSIRISDIGAVVARFGTVQGLNLTEEETIAEALTPPVAATGYHASADRGGSSGPNPWNLLPPNGSIAVGDLGVVVAQFGHSCL